MSSNVACVGVSRTAYVSFWLLSEACHRLLDRSDAHASVATVVEHILQESGPAPADLPRGSMPSALPPPPPTSPAPSAVERRRSMGSTANGNEQLLPPHPQQTSGLSRVRYTPHLTHMMPACSHTDYIFVPKDLPVSCCGAL